MNIHGYNWFEECEVVLAIKMNVIEKQKENKKNKKKTTTKDRVKPKKSRPDAIQT